MRATRIIFRFTLREALSRKVVLAAGIVGMCLLALFAMGFASLDNTVSDGAFQGIDAVEARLMPLNILTAMGLLVVQFVSGVLALFLSVGTVSTEVDQRTIYAVLARPVRRSEWLLGRWLGVGVLMLVYVTLMVGGILVIVRGLGGFSTAGPLQGVVLVWAECMALVTIGVLCSTRMPALASGMIGFSLFGVAWVGGLIGFIGKLAASSTMESIGQVVRVVMPTDGLWRAASYNLQPPAVLDRLGILGDFQLPFVSRDPTSPVFMVWALVWIVSLFALAVWSFQTREL